MRFFIGLHQPTDAWRFASAFISVNRLRNRKAVMRAQEWIMDSGAFTEISMYGRYRTSVQEYAREIRRWSHNSSGKLLAAVSQDWMCEPFILKKTGLELREHQRLTVERFDALTEQEVPVYLMPVLQGYAPEDYVRHVGDYGARLSFQKWVGVGSVCKRNGDPNQIVRVLQAIKDVRPDLQLHGFGLKTTALEHPGVQALLSTADSMAWSYHARINGRNGNDWREAERWNSKIAERMRLSEIQLAYPFQGDLF